MEPMMSVAELRKMMNISDEGVRREIQRGRLKAYRIGRMYRFKIEDVEAYLEEVSVNGWL